MRDQYSPPPEGLAGARVWAYLRDSGGPSQEQSVGQQEHEITAYCKKHNLVLDRVFSDVARSGGSVIGRDAFMSMMDVSQDASNRPAALLIWNFARFARDYNDSVFYKATLHKRGILVHSLTDQIPADDFAGRVVETVITLANEEKRRQTSRDVKRGLRALVSKGYSPGVAPRGYKAVKVTIGEKRDGSPRIVSKWEPDSVLAEYVKIAFELRAQGKSYKEIEEATQGKLYTTVNSWHCFFKNKSYLGYGICGDLEIPDHHEPLINFETWEAAQRMIRAHPKYGLSGELHHPRRVGNPNILSGFTYCMECGSMVTHGTGNKKYPWRYYMCGKKSRSGYSSCKSKRIGAKNAETQILAAILSHVLTIDFLSDVIADIKRQFASTEEIERQITAARRTVEDLDISIQRTLNAIEKTGSHAAQERLKLREAERIQAKNELQRLLMQLETAQIEITPEAMQIILDAWRDQFTKAQETGNIKEIKAVLMQFVSRIEIGYNKARIFFTYPMTDFFQSGSKQSNVVSQCGGTPSNSHLNGGCFFMGQKEKATNRQAGHGTQV